MSTDFMFGKKKIMYAGLFQTQRRQKHKKIPVEILNNFSYIYYTLKGFKIRNSVINTFILLENFNKIFIDKHNLIFSITLKFKKRVNTVDFTSNFYLLT